MEASFRDELAKTLANGFTADEVAAAKKALRDQRTVGRSQDGRLLKLIATREEFGRTLAWDEQMDAKLEALTVDQVNAAFRRHVSLDQLSIVKAGDFQAAGLLAVPLERREMAPSMLDAIEKHLRSHRTRRPFVVHRIDRDTSGLVVFAKHATALATLKEQFKRHEPERVYRAVVYGRPEPASGTWRDRLVWDDRSLIQKQTHPRDPDGKDAVSEYRTVETFRDTSLVEVRLVTGKRNQIRLQARLRGHTLVGEQRYVYGPATLRPIDFDRQALHAFRLAFVHPMTRERIEFEAAMPADLVRLVAKLRADNRQPRS